MKFIYLFLILALCPKTFSQEKETVYSTIENSNNKKNEKIKFKDLLFTQFEISTPLVFNAHRGEKNEDGTVDKNWFLPNGLGAKVGIGLQPEEGWIAISANTGIDWKLNPKMVVVPFYGNLRVTFFITDETKINLQSGLGKGIALGRGAMYSTYQKYNIGIEDKDNLSIFAEVSFYDFKSNPEHTFGSLSVGIGFRI